MKILLLFVISIRFLLEVAFIVGWIYGIIKADTYMVKAGVLVLGMLIIGIWTLWVSPKAPYLTKGYIRLILEVVAFSTGTIICYYVFGKNIGISYGILSVLDLALLYVIKFRYYNISL